MIFACRAKVTPPTKPEPAREETLRSSDWVGEEAARRSAICRSLAYAASNYYDELYLRTGNTAADSMEKLAAIFESVWVNKHGNTAASSPTEPSSASPRAGGSSHAD
jgi:hypothetical protein